MAAHVASATSHNGFTLETVQGLTESDMDLRTDHLQDPLLAAPAIRARRPSQTIASTTTPEDALTSDPEDFDLDDIPMDDLRLSESEGEEAEGEGEARLRVDESLEKATRYMHEKQVLQNAAKSRPSIVGTQPAGAPSVPVVAQLTKKPEVIDDFIRNFFTRKQLDKSLEAFQNEWYEKMQTNQLTDEDISHVPDVYQRNLQLDALIQQLRQDVETHKNIALEAQSTYDRLRKERDFHRMHHKRVVQEKNKMAADLKRLQQQCDAMVPILKGWQSKYEAATKERMLTALERDRLLELGSNLVPIGSNNGSPTKPKHAELHAPKHRTEKVQKKIVTGFASARDNFLPTEDRPNPYRNATLTTASKVDTLKLTHSIKAHGLAISSIKFQPKKSQFATVSDDHTWRLWNFPTGELLATGEGHKDWIADGDFDAKGQLFATASGDGTVRVWDAAKATCKLILGDHTQAVWSCAFHDTADALVSASMDHTAKLWDLHTGKCRLTFRGHGDSVNHIVFQPFTNQVWTCSGDKTVSHWDARSGLCVQTLYGHANAVTHAVFSLTGETFISCDMDGVLKWWDIRNTTEMGSVAIGSDIAAHRLSLDGAANVLAVAASDGTVPIFNAREQLHISTIGQHSESIQSVAFDPSSSHLISGGADGTFYVWS